jgi:hypothetical protein
MWAKDWIALDRDQLVKKIERVGREQVIGGHSPAMV